MQGLQAGLVSVTFRQLPPREVVELAAEAQLAGIEWGGDIHVPHGDLSRAGAVGRMTRDAGLSVAAYGSYYVVGISEGDGLHFEEVLVTALELGAPLIRVWAGRAGPGQTDAAQRQLIVTDSRRIAGLAADARVRVAYEFHGGTMTETASSTLGLLRDVGHANMTTLWQTPVGMGDADCAESLLQLLPAVQNLHVFYWGLGQFADRHPLTDGADRWRMLIGLLGQNQHRPPGGRYLLLEFVAGDAPDAFHRDARALRGLIAEADVQPMYTSLPC